MRIEPYTPSFAEAAAGLFVAQLAALRVRVTALPDALLDTSAALELVGGFLHPERALVALEGERLVGYLGWWIVDGFRDTDRRAAYSPEFGHASVVGHEARVESALYAAASEHWFHAGCDAHALTCLAGQAGLERRLFEAGFGMMVEDALRPATPIADAPPPQGVTVRRATERDASVIAGLDTEHKRHYSRPPTLMTERRPHSQDEVAAFVQREPNTVWLAEASGEAQAFLQFEPVSDGAVRISLAPTTISITGAWTRPAWRGIGVATALLARAIDHYAARGIERVAVDYETINPNASRLWRRHFTPVAESYVRVPERAPGRPR